MSDYNKYKKYKFKYKYNSKNYRYRGGSEIEDNENVWMINLVKIGRLNCVTNKDYYQINLQDGDTADYGSTEALILYFLNMSGLLLKTFTKTEMVNCFQQRNVVRELETIIEDNREVIENVAFEVNPQGEADSGGPYSITADNAEEILENTEEVCVRFLKNYCLLLDKNCWKDLSD